MDPALDELDRLIVRELEQDGRRPFREIARSLEVSEATVRARVRRMEQAGALRIVAFADPAHLGGPERLALLLLTVAAGAHDDVLARLEALPEVAYLSAIVGPADVCAQVLVEDDAALWRFVNDVVRALPGVTAVQTIVEVEVRKLRYAGQR
jgi:Lrp/AsnC family transcriptional regulator, regulator for asnA, asnC and gidA